MFKIGDEVVCTESHDGNIHIIGKSGRIALKNDIEYLVVFDEFIDGHEGYNDEAGEPSGEYGYCWWIRPTKLELANFTLENE